MIKFIILEKWKIHNLYEESSINEKDQFFMKSTKEIVIGLVIIQRNLKSKMKESSIN